MQAIPEVVEATYVGGRRLRLRFASGELGLVDLSGYASRGPIFEPFLDEEFFRMAKVEGGTVTWPNGADIAPERLFELLGYGEGAPARASMVAEP